MNGNQIILLSEMLLTRWYQKAFHEFNFLLSDDYLIISDYLPQIMIFLKKKLLISLSVSYIPNLI